MRGSRFLACVVLGALALAGCTSGSVGSGIAAFSVHGHEVSQSDVDKELEELAESKPLRKLVEQQNQQQPGGGLELSRSGGSINSDLAASWLSTVIAVQIAERERVRADIKITAADRRKARGLGQQNVGGTPVFASLSEWFQDRIIKRWASVAALQRQTSAADVARTLRQSCPSGRYASHILVATQAEADQVVTDLNAGGDFAAIASERSIDTGSAQQGGYLGCIDGQQFVEPFSTVVATQPPGEVSTPFQTEFGFHVVLIGGPSDAEVESASQSEILNRAAGVKVDIDPRYGTWDRKNGRVIPPQA
jgi:hypothetical protein